MELVGLEPVGLVRETVDLLSGDTVELVSLDSVDLVIETVGLASLATAA